MTGTPPPWQVTYDRFRQLYPTGGLILDLAATPTAHCPYYVVKATAQVGHLTLLSVLGEAPHLEDAETQACQKLFQVLRLTIAEVAPDLPTPLTSPTALPEFPSPVHSGLIPKLTPKPVPLTNPPEPATLPEPPTASPPIPDHPPDYPPEYSPVPKPVPPNPPSLKSEPYGIQPLGRTELMDPEDDDWSEELAQIEAEVKRLGWTHQQESYYLQKHYGKLSRDHITDYGELLQFLTDLQGQPSPLSSPGGSDTWNPDAIPPQARPLNLTLEQQGVVPSGSRQDLMDQVLAEIHRIGWTARQGSEYLQQTYQVKTRQELTHAQLQEFVLYLQHQP